MRAKTSHKKCFFSVFFSACFASDFPESNSDLPALIASKKCSCLRRPRWAWPRCSFNFVHALTSLFFHRKNGSLWTRSPRGAVKSRCLKSDFWAKCRTRAPSAHARKNLLHALTLFFYLLRSDIYITVPIRGAVTGRCLRSPFWAVLWFSFYFSHAFCVFWPRRPLRDAPMATSPLQPSREGYYGDRMP